MTLKAAWHPTRWARTLAMAVLFSIAGSAAAAPLPQEVIQAIGAAQQNKATRFQEALLVQYNRDINMARLNNYLTDGQYQAAQQAYATVNERLARTAAQSIGAEFSVQAPKKPGEVKVYSPGTDSDFIIKNLQEPHNPVGQIYTIRHNYNQGMNEFLKGAYVQAGRGAEFQPRNDWHERLDVDFMLNPAFATDAQFRQIAQINNGAYARRAAAEYEAIVRSGGTPSVEQTIAYVEEMKEQIKGKQQKMAEYEAHPEKLNTPEGAAEMHLRMAQEQKYIERIESATLTLRRAANLPPPQVNGAIEPRGQQPDWAKNHQDFLRDSRKGLSDPELQVAVTSPEKGTGVTIQQRQPSIAERGAIRSPENFGTTESAHRAAEQTAARAVREFGESLGQAYAQDPQKYPNAVKQIATITTGSPLMNGAGLSQLSENVELRTQRDSVNEPPQVRKDRVARAKELGTKVLEEIGKRTNGTRADDSLKNGLEAIGINPEEKVKTMLGKFGVSPETKDLSDLRRRFNGAAGPVLDKLTAIKSGIDTLLTIKDAAGKIKDYITEIKDGLDPRISDAEAQRHFQKAQQIAIDMLKDNVQAAAMATIFKAVPTVGQLYGSFMLGYDGGRFILEHTETGRRIDRAMTDYFDRHLQSFQNALDYVTELAGGTTARMSQQEQTRFLQGRYTQMIKDGKIELQPGVTVQQFMQAVANNDVWGIDQMVKPKVQGKSQPGLFDVIP